MAVDGDTPTLPPDHFHQGFEHLDNPKVDIVLGPCEDGGYYAIGMKEKYPTLFDVTMSTPSVVDDTLAQAQAASLHVALLSTWYGVDTAADLQRLQAELDSDPTKAPATSRFLIHSQQPEG